jgi:hypothetical protein
MKGKDDFEDKSPEWTSKCVGELRNALAYTYLDTREIFAVCLRAGFRRRELTLVEQSGVSKNFWTSVCEQAKHQRRLSGLLDTLVAEAEIADLELGPCLASLMLSMCFSGWKNCRPEIRNHPNIGESKSKGQWPPVISAEDIGPAEVKLVIELYRKRYNINPTRRRRLRDKVVGGIVGFLIGFFVDRWALAVLAVVSLFSAAEIHSVQFKSVDRDCAQVSQSLALPDGAPPDVPSTVADAAPDAIDVIEDPPSSPLSSTSPLHRRLRDSGSEFVSDIVADGSDDHPTVMDVGIDVDRIASTDSGRCDSGVLRRIRAIAIRRAEAGCLGYLHGGEWVDVTFRFDPHGDSGGWQFIGPARVEFRQFGPSNREQYAECVTQSGATVPHYLSSLECDGLVDVPFSLTVPSRNWLVQP